MKNNIMSFDKFNGYMSQIEEEYKWRENVIKLGLNITDKEKSFYTVINLLSFIFEDEYGLIPFFIFETNFGHNENVVLYVDVDNISTTRQLYDFLVSRMENK